MSNKITFLGTGTSQGVPLIACNCEVCQSKDSHDKRLRSSILIEYNDLKIVIDTGPDFRYQMLRENVMEIDAILFTHSHKDHTGGLDDVRAFNYILERNMDIYAEKSCMDVIKKDYDYAFAEFKYPGVPELTPHIISEEPFYVKELKVTPIRGTHHRLPVLGYRIGNTTYITDMNHISDEEVDKIKGSEILIITALRREKHLSHFSLDEAIAVSKKSGARETYFTHISHQLGLYEDVSKSLPENMYLAYDGLQLELK